MTPTNNSWLCTKCNTRNARHVKRCSFCSNPRPTDEQIKVIEQVIADKTEGKTKQDVHNAIEKLTPPQCMRLWRWMEDNLL